MNPDPIELFDFHSGCLMYHEVLFTLIEQWCTDLYWKSKIKNVRDELDKYKKLRLAGDMSYLELPVMQMMMEKAAMREFTNGESVNRD